MKKVLLTLIALIAVGGTFGRGMIARGIASVISLAGTEALGVPFSIESVKLGLLGGQFGVKGVSIGNPQGCATPECFHVRHIDVTADLRSMLSDVPHIQEIRIRGPEITLEVTSDGTNLGKLVRAAHERRGGDSGGEKSAPTNEKPPAQKNASKRLIVDRVIIENAMLRIAPTALASTELTIPLPPIQLDDLSAGGEPVELGEIFERVFGEISNIAGQQGNLPANLKNVLQGDVGELLPQILDKKGRKKLEKDLKGLKDIFKK